MHGKYTWALAALAWYGILMRAHRTALVTVAGAAVFPWLYRSGYLVFGVAEAATARGEAPSETASEATA